MQGFQFVSDLHLEFPENRDWLKKHPIAPVAPVLWLGGDIAPLKQLHEFGWFWQDLQQKFEAVYWIPGNHEFYFGNAAKALGPRFETLFPGIFLVNQACIFAYGYRFLAATLWTSATPAAKPWLEAHFSDFKLIQYGENHFQVEQMLALHVSDRQFFKLHAGQPTQTPTVYLSHHAPIPHLAPPFASELPLKQALCADLSDHLANFEPGLWLYGHTHYPRPDFTFKGIRFAQNQLGYLRHGQQTASDFSKVYANHVP